ncbi:hypothetical protein [Hyphomicrobium sp.]|uniref:hypothetical protein n=1 Tax=Hyphomicrobium sp. TaxID=82 RepID=UPI000F98B841|nr:hypothetical protein [Hyphomicrobium sp.]RUP00014.1 MAG: hypothetical protein EKK30_02535 [Hyphomicrobium sp.]
MTNQTMTKSAVGKIKSWGVFASSAELEFVLETDAGPMDLKTEESTDPRAFTAMAAVLSSAYLRDEAVYVTYFEDTRFVDFVGLPVGAWASISQ